MGEPANPFDIRKEAALHSHFVYNSATGSLLACYTKLNSKSCSCIINIGCDIKNVQRSFHSFANKSGNCTMDPSRAFILHLDLVDGIIHSQKTKVRAVLGYRVEHP